MRKQKFSTLLMALVAMSFFNSPLAIAQDSANKTFKIKTPNTKSELKETIPAKEEKSEEDTFSGTANSPHSGAPRRLQQHGLGIGLGQTFLLGNYSKYGQDKITFDLLYSYAASYSFDLLLNAHMSEHKDESERMKVMGLTSSIKGRFVEYDNFSPYFLGGLGFYAPQAKRVVGGDNEWSSRKITFGLNFGGGVDLRLNDNYVVGVLGQMHWPFKVEQDSGPDVKGYYFKLLLTGMYLF
jgi:opacity protein-like surface antigen